VAGTLAVTEPCGSKSSRVVMEMPRGAQNDLYVARTVET